MTQGLEKSTRSPAQAEGGGCAVGLMYVRYKGPALGPRINIFPDLQGLSCLFVCFFGKTHGLIARIVWDHRSPGQCWYCPPPTPDSYSQGKYDTSTVPVPVWYIMLKVLLRTSAL